MINLIEFRQSKIDELVTELLSTIKDDVIAIISLEGIDRSIFSVDGDLLKIYIDEEKGMYLNENNLAKFWYSLPIHIIKKHVKLIMDSYYYLQEQFQEYSTCEELDKLISSLKEDF